MQVEYSHVRQFACVGYQMSKLHYRCEDQKRKARVNIGIIKRKTEQNETTSNYSY